MNQINVRLAENYTVRRERFHSTFGTEARVRIPDEASGANLTLRECEVLQLIAEGRSNKEMATELGVAVKTIEKHRQHLMDKLGIHNIAGLTRYAISTGVIECSVQTISRGAFIYPQVLQPGGSPSACR